MANKPMTPQEAHGVLAQASARALLNEPDRLQVFEANRVLQAHLQPAKPESAEGAFGASKFGSPKKR